MNFNLLLLHLHYTTPNIFVTLLENAAHSIEAGIEDYQQGSERRNVSAVRNVFAAMLLLFKEKLARLSPEYEPELLIKKDIFPARNNQGEIIFTGRGTKTVDVQSIKERFKSLKITVDWNRFDEINKLRNDIEHYYTGQSSDKVRQILAKSFLVIRDFLVNELKEAPASIIELNCWAKLLEIEEIYSAEQESCLQSLRSISWKYQTLKNAVESFRCLTCDSALVKYKTTNIIGIILECCSCGHDFEAASAIPTCIKGHFYIDDYIAAMDGGEYDHAECPECGEETFVFEEGACVACDYKPSYHQCLRCHNDILLQDQDLDGFCSYCYNLIEKVMSE